MVRQINCCRLRTDVDGVRELAQAPPQPLNDVAQLRLLLGAAGLNLPEDPAEGELSLAHLDASSL